MYKNKKVSIVLPAYNCSKTLEKTYLDIPFQIVDEVILVDDNSTDNTIDIALKLGINHVIKHHINLGYGANQKTCYNKALELNSDIIVMLHPDYQYTPLLIESMVSIIGNDLYDYKNLKNEQIINSKKYLKIYPEDSIILIEGYI
jgi:glycosyltransferase involved in cell wall biosynthesis